MSRRSIAISVVYNSQLVQMLQLCSVHQAMMLVNTETTIDSLTRRLAMLSAPVFACKLS